MSLRDFAARAGLGSMQRNCDSNDMIYPINEQTSNKPGYLIEPSSAFFMSFAAAGIPVSVPPLPSNIPAIN